MGLYQDLEDEVIADIARRVKNTGRYTETAELMAKSMVEQGYSAEKIQAEVMSLLRADTAYRNAVAENTVAYKQEIQDIINQTVREAKAAGNELIAEAGNMAWNNDLSMWKEHGVDLTKPNSMSQLLNAFQTQTAGELKNLTRSMGFKNTVFGTTGVLNAYQREMDLALLKVATGAFSYDQAVNDCVHRLAQSGLRSIDYASGRTYQLDTAARMSVRTGLSQLAGKVMEANLESTGQDLVITSQHMGSRPEHAPWQNKVFSYSGKNKKYPDFFKETGYGTATGLKGVNCTHDFYPFWEGASVIPDDLEEPAPVTVNGKEYTYYQATQQQRKMERDIRATKREIEAQRAIGGDTKLLQSKLNKQMSDYKRFSAKAGVKPKENRLRVVKGTSQTQKHRNTPKRTSKSEVDKAEWKILNEKYNSEDEAFLLGTGSEYERYVELNKKYGVYVKEKKSLPDFEPMSKKDIMEYANANIEANIDFSGASESAIRSTVNTLAKLQDKGISFDGMKIEFNRPHSDAYGFYDPKTNTIHIPKNDKFVEKLIRDDAKSISKFGAPQHAVSTYEGNLLHEIGHYFDYQFNQELSRKLTNNEKLMREAFKISGYAPSTSGMGSPRASEAFAECFSAYFSPGHEDKVPDGVVKIIEKALGKTPLENSNTSGTLNMDLQFFARSSKDYETIWLSKDEYAHVMSELNTHMSDKQRNQKVVTKAIGNYYYTVENNGFDEYRVIGKVAIDDDFVEWWDE